MFNNLGRVITTLFIWGIALILSIMCLYMWSDEGMPAVFAMFIIITVLSMITYTTSIVWRNAGLEKRNERPTVQVPVNLQHQGKAKRTPKSTTVPSIRDEKLALLYELMDDGERRAFKRALQDEYLNQRSRSSSFNDLIDGELPFDADPYFEDEDDYYGGKR